MFGVGWVGVGATVGTLSLPTLPPPPSSTSLAESGASGGQTSGLPVPMTVRGRFFNLEQEQVRRMRDLNPADIDTLVSIKGMVIRSSAMIPDLRSAFFQCQSCGEGIDVPVDRGRVDEPPTCAKCGAKHPFARIDNRGTYLDKQLIKLQETPESVPEGETPQTVLVYAHEDLCEMVVPGDRVTITGVYRAIPTRPNARQRTSKAVFKTYLDVIHFHSDEKGRMAHASFMEGERPTHEGVGSGEVGAEAAALARRARCEAMAREPNLYAALAHSLAPSVWEMEDVKKGLLLMLFGGVNKDLGKEGKIRGEINVLLCGDPGAAKSQLLSYVHKRAPRGIYTSGKGSSAVGLTASIVKVRSGVGGQRATREDRATDGGVLGRGGKGRPQTQGSKSDSGG